MQRKIGKTSFEKTHLTIKNSQVIPRRSNRGRIGKYTVGPNSLNEYSYDNPYQHKLLNFNPKKVFEVII